MAQSGALVRLAAAAAAAASPRHRPSRASRTSRPAHRRPPCLSCRTSPRSRIPRRARSASVRRVRVVRRRLRRGSRAPSAPDAVRAGAPEARRPAPRPATASVSGRSTWTPRPAAPRSAFPVGSTAIRSSPAAGPCRGSQLRLHDRSDPRHPAPLREPRDTPPEVGYAVAEVVQLVDGGHGAGLNAPSRTPFLPLSDQRPALCACRCLPSWEERRPRTEGGCAGGVGRLRSGGGS